MKFLYAGLLILRLLLSRFDCRVKNTDTSRERFLTMQKNCLCVSLLNQLESRECIHRDKDVVKNMTGRIYFNQTLYFMSDLFGGTCSFFLYLPISFIAHSSPLTLRLCVS